MVLLAATAATAPAAAGDDQHTAHSRAHHVRGPPPAYSTLSPMVNPGYAPAPGDTEAAGPTLVHGLNK